MQRQAMTTLPRTFPPQMFTRSPIERNRSHYSFPQHPTGMPEPVGCLRVREAPRGRRSVAFGWPSLPCPVEGPGVLPPEAVTVPDDRWETAERRQGHGQVMWVSRGRTPIGRRLGGYHHGNAVAHQARARNRRRQEVPLGLPCDRRGGESP